MLVVLLGSAAFAIDVTMWHLEQTREQKAADAAALAGAVTFPGDATKSDAAALDVATQNGYAPSSISSFGPNGSCALGPNVTIRICTGPGDQPAQYKVTVLRQVNNLLGGIFGIILGVAVSYLIGTLAGWGFMFSPVTPLVAVLFSLLVGVVFGVWPARQAARLDPIVALRYE